MHLNPIVFFLLMAGLSSAHEDMDMDMSHDDHPAHLTSTVSFNPQMTAVPHVMHHKHGVPILETDLLPEELAFWQAYNTTNYMNYPGSNKTSLYLYLSLMFVSFVILNPLLMVVNNISKQSLTYLCGLVVNTCVTLVGLLNYSIFMASIPDLYPNNAFNKFNWIYLFTVPAQLVLAVFKTVYLKNDYHQVADYDEDLSDDNSNSPSITLYDLSRNQSPSSFDLSGRSNTQSIDETDPAAANDLEASVSDIKLHLDRLKSNSFNSLFTSLAHTKIIQNFGYTCLVLFNMVNWFNFLFFLIYVPTGVATFGLLGMGNTVFNLLAHFIKGGVFFLLGMVSLARYCGAWENKGFAWNYKFIYKSDKLNRWQKWQPIGLITMEWIESFLVFFYGSTNIFMEHLANPGGAWSAKDLEHVSIAFIFLGCGVCGLITESKLNNWRFNYSNPNNKSVIKSSPGFSPNPFPLMCIFWTGILMSQHQQASELSTKIHAQWGSLLAYGSFFRFATYVLNMLLPKPLDLTRPTKPITELVTSFALLAGGLIFMESCDPVILALEYRGYDAMFTLNICLGLVFLFMGWIMAVFQFKAWLAKRYR